MDFRYVIKGASAPEKVILFPLSDEREEEQLPEEIYQRVLEKTGAETQASAAETPESSAAHGASKRDAGAVPFAIVGIFVPDWDRYLSPRKFEGGRRQFSGDGDVLLTFIQEKLLPELMERFQPASEPMASAPKTSAPEISAPEASGRASSPEFYLGGYSLSGLFCLWAALKSGLFAGCASCSGSVWYPGFTEQVLGAPNDGAGAVNPMKIYLSLGTKEEKTRDPYMREVGNCTRRLYEHFSSDPAHFSTVLEWNPGNHFRDVPERIAKGFSWLLNA